MLEVVSTGRPWSFDGGGDRFRLVSEAYCIRLANLFDPMLAVSTSLVEPLPHRIAADYGEMLPRHPLHFLLADDPGAGKTIMTGLLIKELMLRGDLSRCLIVCPREPGRTVAGRTPPPVRPALRNPDQRQAGVCAHGNRFQENPLAICRLDKLSRNEDVQAKLEQNDWDLVIRGEAHKMALPSSAARSWCRGSAAEGAVMRSQAGWCVANSVCGADDWASVRVVSDCWNRFRTRGGTSFECSSLGTCQIPVPRNRGRSLLHAARCWGRMTQNQRRPAIAIRLPRRPCRRAAMICSVRSCRSSEPAIAFG